ncbi:MAG: hypothetical protein QM680_01305 [Luteolibacter sp.]
MKSLFIIAISCGISVSCSLTRDAVVEQRKSDVSKVIKIGDNIYAARDDLRSAGFQATEPYFATVSKSYYRMDINYDGVSTTGLEVITYSFGLPRNKSNLISGVVYARLDGTIYEIK